MIATATQNNMRIVVIPAKSREEIRQAERLLRVAAYCRVSTDQEEQESSYEAQIGYYTEKIKNNEELFQKNQGLPAAQQYDTETIRDRAD